MATGRSGLVRRAAASLKQLEYRVTAFLAVGLLRIFRLVPPDRAIDFAARMARRIGPWTGRHRVARTNLRLAFPDKSDAEIEAIALDMWANMGRLAAEYVYLDRLFDFDATSGKIGRVEVVGEDLFARIRHDGRAKIMVTAHLGCFELLPTAAQAYGLHMASLFRPPNNPYIADEILKLRKSAKTELVASRSGVAFSLARILARGGTIGALVDQKFHGGLPTTFFGRACETSPLVPRLARQYDCDVYAGRCVRLPGNRYRMELIDRLDLPRNAEGDVDATATAQMLNDLVESWIREEPGQWMWFHRRWEIRSAKAKQQAATG